MKTLKTLTAAITLTVLLGMTAFAQTPPPCGQLDTPPCQGAHEDNQGSESPVTAGASGSTLSSSAPVADETYAEIAKDVICGILSIY
jgi:hypothetical protein